MYKDGKRFCDKCKKRMPMLREEQSNAHDVICIGYKTSSGTVLSQRKDICTHCMDKLDEFLSGE